MDSSNLFRKTLRLFEKLKEHDSDKVSIVNELFERLLLFKNKYRICFDLESLYKLSLKDIDNNNNYYLENDIEDVIINSLKIKKNIKKLFNLSLLYLLQLIQDEKYFEFTLDKLVDLMEFEFDMTIEIKGVKNVEFLELFLNTLLYGNFYNKGLVQHFLLNSRYTFHLPFTLNNIIKNIEKNKKFNGYLNKDNNLIDIHTFYERFLIFVSKLITPDIYIPNESKQDKVLKIPKKELALKNPINYLENNNSNNRELLDNKDGEDKEEEDLDSEEVESEDEDDKDIDDNEDDEENEYNVDELFYGNNYIKLWDNILNEVLYLVDGKNLTIILESLPHLAFPYLDNPLRIANYLYNNLENDIEDVVINSLNCLFELILYNNLTDQINIVIMEEDNSKDNKDSSSTNNNTSNNIDNSNYFDWFYQKLYNLIDFKYLSSKSNVILILLIEKALNSSMLPNNLISSFIKKLLSTSTLLETNTCNCLLIISLNLLQKHYHHLLFLIHSPCINTQNNSKDNKDSSSTNNNTSNNIDNTNPPESDVLVDKDNTKELIETHNGLTNHEKIFLHELYLLLNHFNYDTVKIIGLFFTDLRLKNKISFNLRDFLYSENLVKNLEKSKNSELNPFKTTVQNTTTLTRSFFE